MSSIVPLLGAGAIGLLVLHIFRHLTSKSLPLPPGPPPLPIIGNIHQVPKTYAWRQLAAWRKEYGPIYHLNMLGQHLIILTTSQAAYDLLAKRGAVFSDRPKMFVAQELALKHMNILLMDYDERFKLQQRLEATVLGQNTATKYHDFHAMESRQLLLDLLNNAGGKGTNVHGYFERATASNVFALFYGFRIKDPEAPELLTEIQLEEEFSEFVQVGAHLVDTFPALNILPGPLAPWKAKAESHFQRKRKIYLENLDHGLSKPGWTFAKQIHKTMQKETLPMSHEELAFAFGAMVDAALDGTVGTMMWFLIAIITQDNGFVTRAKKQLDEVVGRNRLPAFEDLQKLPYINAIFEETLRWRPVGAGGVPHFTKVQSEYQGYQIPANSIVVANIWAISREEAVFGSDTDSFIPERWLEGEQLQQRPVAGFGYGRRICPGRHFARNVTLISMARILWAFDIKAGIEETGESSFVDPVGCTDGLIMRALPFKASFEPSHEKAQEIILKQCQTHDEDLPAILNKIGDALAKK